MAASSGHYVVLLLDPARRMLMPTSTAAFELAQGRQASLRRRTAGNLVIESDGTVRRIDALNVVGPIDGRWVGHILFGLSRIAVRFSAPLPMDAVELRKLLLDAIDADPGWSNFNEDPADRAATVVRVRAATTARALFAAFRLPAIEDSLDLL